MLLDPPAALAFSDQADVVDAAARARRFARRVIGPVALELDRRLERDHDYFPWDLVCAAAADGWLTGPVPALFGGEGMSIAGTSAAMEELCAGCAGVANIIGAHGLGMLPIMLSMDYELSSRLLRELVRGASRPRPALWAFAITEPGGGSDVEEAEGLTLGDVRTFAERVPGGYRIHGRKVFISNGSVAERVVVFAALDRADPRSSWTGFVVRSSEPGFHCARVERKMGQRACPAAELVFEGAFVPAALRVGGEGGGWELSRRVLAVSRGPVGAIAVGIARGAFEAACQYVRRARRAGTAGAGDSWIDDTLADMVIRIRAARASYLEAARHCDRALLPSPRLMRVMAKLAAEPTGIGTGLVRAATARRAESTGDYEAWRLQAILGATAKVTGSDAAMHVTTRALDLIPPTAGDLRRRAEKAFRDAKLTQIYEGTNQINRRAVAQEGWEAVATPAAENKEAPAEAGAPRDDGSEAA